jgi:phenylacetate-CoA ligase
LSRSCPEVLIRRIPTLTGEYRIRLYEEEHLTRFDLEIELEDGAGRADALVETVSDAIQARLGLQPKRVTVFANGTLPRTTHKAKRVGAVGTFSSSTKAAKAAASLQAVTTPCPI